ncbi:Mobile element protein [Geitlerinema sp. FC II]|nr:Mobile element protein [Geitlerinema sp. FC II]
MPPEAVKKSVNLLSDRLREFIDYRTPSEVFYNRGSETVAFLIRNPNLNASTPLSVESERSRGLKHWFFQT